MIESRPGYRQGKGTRSAARTVCFLGRSRSLGSTRISCTLQFLESLRGRDPPQKVLPAAPAWRIQSLGVASPCKAPASRYDPAAARNVLSRCLAHMPWAGRCGGRRRQASMVMPNPPLLRRHRLPV